MTFPLSYPNVDGSESNLIINAAEVLYVLGANGTGKSSLMQRFYQTTRPFSRRISAHRQTWFTSNTLDLTPLGKRNTEQSMANTDSNLQSRYMDSYAPQRASLTVFDLIDAQNVRARSIAAAVDASDLVGAVEKSTAEAPLKAINALLKQSNIPIEIDVIENEQIVARKNGGAPYSIAELSDGERNTLLIAGDVLTSKPGSLIIIDEPERHLHRSIISPLLTALFNKRNDCAFVIATHDIDLPLDNETARVLLVRSANYAGSNPQSWEADLLESGVAIDEQVKRDVLGSRRKIVFVEGNEDSLDKPLYSLIFPMVSMVSKETCREVEQSVRGLRSVQPLSWVRAWGIVDRDNRSDDEVANLNRQSIFAIAVYSVEGIYYHPRIIRMVAERQAKVTGAHADRATVAAINAGLDHVSRQKTRMIHKAATRAARERVLMQLPTVPSVAAGTPVSVNLDVAAIVAEKESELNAKIEAKDWDGIVKTCPIRESGALDGIRRAVGLPTVKDYEAAVRTLLTDDSEALAFVRGLFGHAAAQISGD